MKKTLQFLMFIALFNLLSCSAPGEKNEAEIPERSYIVYTTNNPLYYFTSRIAPENFEVRFPMREATDPAYWDVNTDTVVAMRSADLIILNGAGYEQWIGQVSLPESAMLNTTDNLSDRLLEGEETLTHSHGPEGEHVHASMAFTTWLDPDIAQMQAKAIRDALIRLDSSSAVQIEENFESLSSDLSRLHEMFSEAIDTTWQVAYSHPVYQYFQNAYGVEGPSLHWEHDMEFDSKARHDLGHLLEDNSVDLLIWEKEPAAGIREELQRRGIASVVVDPAGQYTDSDFLEVMRENARRLSTLAGK